LAIIVFFIFLSNCQLKEPNRSHGINFLENRKNVLVVKKTNKNDVIKLIGNPHSTSLKDEDTWMYFERTMTRGKMHKLGRNILKENNILELKFNKYGVLEAKKFYKKDNMKKINYSKKNTENTVTQQSFVGKFLSSVKEKMYGKNKF
jgi:outer membrane protein assembly factor BamE (lipoprotein component of BamABCDE complex)